MYLYLVGTCWIYTAVDDVSFANSLVRLGHGYSYVPIDESEGTLYHNIYNKEGKLLSTEIRNVRKFTLTHEGKVSGLHIEELLQIIPNLSLQRSEWNKGE